MLNYLSATRSALLDVVEARPSGRCFEVQLGAIVEDQLPDDDALGLPYRLPHQLDDLLGQQQVSSSLERRRRTLPRTKAMNRPEEALDGDLSALVVRREI